MVLRKLRCLSGRSMSSIALRLVVILGLGYALVQLAGPRAGDHDHPGLKDDKANHRREEAPKKPVETAIADDTEWKYPLHLDLDLPDSIRNSPVLQDRTKMMRQYGFNLALSNKMPLNRNIPDRRSGACKSIKYPTDMPKTSVIIIYYNEPLSTLLRNVMSVLNRSPPHLLGEIVMVDDNSTLEELKYLPQHLEKLPKKIRHVRRNVHNGIVGARNRGAQEARFPIIAFIDSHAEVMPGWLEPLVWRIHQNRKNVVIPSLRPIDTSGLSVSSSTMWPPAKGSFNWRMSFTHAGVDRNKDIVPFGLGGNEQRTSCVRTPVMPGGIFAMDREWFNDLGGYDPEILYYGGEHLELSFKVWMCGGSMESVPCSGVGHIYRNFDRFAVDPLLDQTKIGPILDRNDLRVAEVWMDEYKKIVYDTRGFHGKDPGDLTDRRAIRDRLQCKSFDWFLKNVHPDLWVPDIEPQAAGIISDPERRRCIDNMQHDHGGPVGLYGCHGLTTQRWRLMKDGAIANGVACLTFSVLKVVRCEGATDWEFKDGRIRHTNIGGCLTRSVAGRVLLQTCDTSNPASKWGLTEAGMIFSPDAVSDSQKCLSRGDHSLTNWALGTCSEGAWKYKDGQLTSHSSCLAFKPSTTQSQCGSEPAKHLWQMDNDHLSPKGLDSLCLTRSGEQVVFQACSKEHEDRQTWKIFQGV